MNFLGRVAQNWFGMIVISFFLMFLSPYLPFLLVNSGQIEQASLSFSALVDFSALFFMFFVPLLLIKYVLRKPIQDFGIRKPENSVLAVKLSSLIILVLLPILYLFSRQTGFQEYYFIKQGFGLFFILATLGSFVYYFAEEFIFRGFLFFGLWEKLGIHTFWITNILFALLHAGKPIPEVFFAFFSGLMFSYLSFKTKSFLPAVLVHFLLALILNILVIMS